jgi:hypothetical protein
LVNFYKGVNVCLVFMGFSCDIRLEAFPPYSIGRGNRRGHFFVSALSLWVAGGPRLDRGTIQPRARSDEQPARE